MGRRLTLTIAAALVALSTSGCGPDFCSERSLVGFLFCDSSMVHEPEAPQAQIRFERDKGPQGSPTVWVGGTYSAHSVYTNAENPLYPENYVTREQWDVDGLPGYELDYEYGGTTVSRKVDEPLQRTLRLRVTGAEGRYSDASVFLLVTPFSETPGPRPLIVRLNGGPNPAAVGAEVSFFAEVNATEPLAQVEWDLDGVPGYELSGTEQSVRRTYEEPGRIPIYVRVRDANGAVDEDTILLDVQNDEPPVADLRISPNPARPGQEVTFDASGSRDPDGTIDNYEWDLDGVEGYEVSFSDSPTRTQTFEAPLLEQGRLVRVRVTDNLGLQRVAEQRLYVVEGEGLGDARSARASKGTTTLLFARLDLRRLLSAGRRAGRSSVSGVRVRGTIDGKLLDAMRRATTEGPPVLRKLLRGKWDARLTLKRTGGRHSASGLAIVSTRGRRPARVCVKLSLLSQSSRPGEPPLVGSFKVLGGTRGAERLRASARFGLIIRDGGYSVASGRVTSATGSKRGMPARCGKA